MPGVLSYFIRQSKKTKGRKGAKTFKRCMLEVLVNTSACFLFVCLYFEADKGQIKTVTEWNLAYRLSIMEHYIMI